MFPQNQIVSTTKKGPGLVTQVLLHCTLLTWETITLKGITRSD
jgi:hypothetical protein